MQRGAILLIEDDDEIAEALAALLVDGGWDVARASDGRAAMALAGSRAFHAVLLDQLLPAGRGTDLVPELRRLTGGAPVVLVTAVGVAGADAAREHGVAYLAKPFRIEQLEAILVEITSRARRSD